MKIKYKKFHGYNILYNIIYSFLLDLVLIDVYFLLAMESMVAYMAQQYMKY